MCFNVVFLRPFYSYLLKTASHDPLKFAKTLKKFVQRGLKPVDDVQSARLEQFQTVCRSNMGVFDTIPKHTINELLYVPKSNFSFCMIPKVTK